MLKTWIIQAIKFGGVGIINTIVDYIVFSAVTLLGGFAELAQTIGYSAGIVCSFVLNRRITFKKTGKVSVAEPIKFVVVNLVSLLVSVYLMSVVKELPLSVFISKLIIVTPVTLIINFIGSKLFVFKK